MLRSPALKLRSSGMVGVKSIYGNKFNVNTTIARQKWSWEAKNKILVYYDIVYMQLPA